MSIRVKAEHANRVFGFNNKYESLGKRDDCYLLYLDGKSNNDKGILDMFEEFDEEKELLERGEKFKNKRKPIVNKNNNDCK